jgi:DNA-binding Xre family transcriptional regulator
MAISHMIRMALAHKNMKEAELARSIGMTPAGFNYRMQIAKFSSEELGKIADALGAELTMFLEFPDGTKLSEPLKNLTEPAKTKSFTSKAEQRPPKSPEPPPEPGIRTRKAKPLDEKPQEREGTAPGVSVYEAALAERRRQEPDADWEFREKRHAEHQKEIEEAVELKRKLAKEHEELLRKRAEEMLDEGTPAQEETSDDETT